MSTNSPHRFDVAIGQRIRERRRSIAMSQAALAAATGVTFQQIQKYERGANRISFSRLVQVAEALGCPIGALAEGLSQAQPADELEHLNALLAKPGALEMLEAYAALPTHALRRTVLHHARALTQAISAPETEE